jgi:peptide/nickel transport system substrate-binding protein
MIVQQWRAIGIAADMRLFERSLFYTRIRNDQNQMVLFSNNGSESLYLYTVPVLPMDPQSSFGGAAYAQWYATNGASGIAPTDAMLLKGFDLLRGAASQAEDQRTDTAKEIWKLAVDEVWSIGLVGQSPAYMGTRVVNEKLENVPARTCTSQHCRTPWSGHPEQWFYK